MTAAIVHRQRPPCLWAGLALMVVLAALWLAAASRVHVNASWSHDAWGYLVLPVGEPVAGDTVLFEPATGGGVPYLKIVRGLPGGMVTVEANRTVRVDGIALGRAKERALDGRPLEAIAAGTIPDGRYYLHGDHPDSHDSRYAEIGLVPRGRIVGRAIALPDIPWLGLEGPLVGPEDIRSAIAYADPAGDRAMMPAVAVRMFAAVCVVLAILSAPARAADLGVRGATWAIAELDLLVQIEDRLAGMERSGALARFEAEARERARRRLEAPEPVAGIAPARHARSRTLDPSVEVARDIRAHDGTLIAAAGTRIDPFAHAPLTRDLLFVDGRREVEVAWALAHGRPSKIVLLAGRPLDLARRHGRPFHFDQGGRLSRRLGLRFTPSRITREDSLLRIDEIALDNVVEDGRGEQ